MLVALHVALENGPLVLLALLIIVVVLVVYCYFMIIQEQEQRRSDEIKEESQRFRICLQGLAHAEIVLRRCCKEKVKYIQNKLQLSFKKRICNGNITTMIQSSSTGWKSRKIKFTPQCTHRPGCYKYLQQVESKLSAATKLNPYTLFMNIDIENCGNDDWELSKLFLEPWMRTCQFEDLDTYCLLVLLENVDAVYENELRPKEKAYVDTLRREKTRKMKDIAETCLLADNIQMTKEETNICLQSIINLLALVRGDDADETIQSISKMKDLEHTDKDNENIWTRRNKLKTRKEEFEGKVRDFASAIPHDIGNGETKQTAIANVYKIPQTNTDECLQAILYSVEKADKESATEIMNHLLTLRKSPSVLMPASIYEKMHAVLNTVKGTRPLQEMLINEASLMNSKLCRLVFFTIEDTFRTFCEKKINAIHCNVKTQFTRDKLCASAVETDICQPSALAPHEIKFKHDCTANPNCSEFLQSVVNTCSAEGRSSVCKMFNSINPQACLDNSWDFTRVFLQQSMLRLPGFRQLNAYCLLSLLTNVQMLDVPENENNAMRRKVRQVRDVAFKILIHDEAEISTAVKNQCVQHIIDILDSMDTVQTKEETLRQIKHLKEIPTVFDIKQRNKSDETVAAYLKENIVSDDGHSNWCKSALALKYLMLALVPFLKKEIHIIFDDVVVQFQRNSLCPDIKPDDLCYSKEDGAQFRHRCVPSPLPCDAILAIIKNHTHSGRDFVAMIKGTDPQCWLHSPFEFAKLFIKEWIRPGLRELDDFDTSAFCQLVQRSKELKQKVDEDLLNQLRDARNRTMHNAKLNMSQQELEKNLDAILYFLKNHDCLNGREEVKQAIIDIDKLRNAEQKLLHEEAVQVIREVVWPIIEKKHIYESTMYTEVFKTLNFAFGNINAERGTIEEEKRRRTEEQKQASKSLYVSFGNRNAEQETIENKKIRPEEEIQKQIRDLEMQIMFLEGEIANLKTRQDEIEKIKRERFNVSSLRHFTWLVGTVVMIAVTAGLYVLVEGSLEFDVSTLKACDESLSRINDEIRRRHERISRLQHQVTDLQRKLKQLQ